MWQLLDVLLIVIVVLFSGLYSVYSLSSVRIKRAMLSLLVRYVGLRVLSVFSPRIGGCSNCSATDVYRHADVLRKLKRTK